MRIAKTNQNIKTLESYVIRKAVMRSSEGSRWKSASGNSLAAYLTLRTSLSKEDEAKLQAALTKAEAVQA